MSRPFHAKCSVFPHFFRNMLKSGERSLMPELPEVETIRRGLSKFILNRKIQKIEILCEKSFLGKPITGTVVGLLREEDTDSEGFTSIMYIPQIEYKVGEQLYTAKGSGSSDASAHSIGEQIQIMYNPANVQEYLIKGDNSSNIGGIIWIVFGIIMLLIGIKQLIFGR